MENQDLLEALDFINPGSLTYEEWTMVGMGLKQAGFPVTSWEQWSARDGGRYHRGECARKWGSFHGNANPVTENSIFKLARDHGWAGPAGHPLDWNDVIDAPAGRSDGVVVDPHWLDVQELAIPAEWDPVDQLVRYLQALFEPEEHVAYVTESYLRDGRPAPTKGCWDRTAGQLIDELRHYGDIHKVVGDCDPAAGAWICFNPVEGGRSNDNVTDYSIDSGASYQVLEKADNAANRYQASAGTFPSGVIYWRIRTKNTDNEFGDYSGAAIFAIRRAPVAPVISYYDNKPLAKMRWQAKEQDGYEVAVDGISLGVRYGTGKEWQSDVVLTDGPHTLQVRIYNTYGDVSPWSSCEINVQNQPGAALTVYAECRWGEVLLRWDGGDGYILRDGTLIAKAEGGTYTDRTSAAAHQYLVRVFDAEGYYTDSAPVLAAPSVPYAAIGLRDGTEWLALKYATSYQNYSKSVSLGGSYQQYWGKERPVWHDAGNRVVTHTISHACKHEEELLVLRSLAGQEVIYKDHDGHLAIGVFKDLQESREHGCTALSFSITETQQEAVKYDPV